MPDHERVPLFPLQLVLYPGERTALHIFEPRYKLLTARCLETKEPFGVVLTEDDEMVTVGSTARIVKVIDQAESGEMDILVEGGERFQIRSIYDDEPYLMADIDLLSEPEEALNVDERERAVTQHMKLLEIVGYDVRPSLYENVSYLSYVLARNAGLSLWQKQRLLEIASENSRIEFLVDHFEDLIPQVEEREGRRRKIRSNGHFRDFPSFDS